MIAEYITELSRFVAQGDADALLAHVDEGLRADMSIEEQQTVGALVNWALLTRELREERMEQ